MLDEGIGDAATEPGPAPEGDTLRALLKLREMTQQKLAELSGIHTSTISRYVRGERPISRSDWGRLLKALQIRRSSWDAMEDLVYRLGQDRRRFARISKESVEYEDIDMPAAEVREGRPNGRWAVDPDEAHEVVDGIARVFERSLHQITDLLFEARR